MDDKNKLVFPNFLQLDGMSASNGGLTRREFFAAIAMQGLCVQAIPGTHNSDSPWNNEMTAAHAVHMADALLKELDKNE